MGGWNGLLVTAVALIWKFGSRASNDGTSRDWPAYGGTARTSDTRDLRQIDRTNVRRLEVAWTFDAADGAGGLQTQPIIVDGVLYANTPKHRVIALDAATGRSTGSSTPASTSAARTVASHGGRTATIDGSSPASIDSCTRSMPGPAPPIPSFGRDGRIDLHEDLGRDPTSSRCG